MEPPDGLRRLRGNGCSRSRSNPVLEGEGWMRRESYRSGSSQPSTKNSLVGRNFSLAGAFAAFVGKKGENIGPWVLAFCSKDQKSFAFPLPNILHTNHFGQEVNLSPRLGPPAP